VALNVIRRPGVDSNVISDILRRWFGPDAGMPGTSFKVALEQSEEGYKLSPLKSAGRSEKLKLWESYAREQIPALFGAEFNKSIWQSGFVMLPGNALLLVTLEKAGVASEFQYEDKFLSPELIQWQSQNRTSQASKVGQSLLNHRDRGIRVHLFVRRKKRSATGGGAPFTYCGELNFVNWQGDRPITIQWRLASKLPDRLWKLFS
jgi:hypothetical protein